MVNVAVKRKRERCDACGRLSDVLIHNKDDNKKYGRDCFIKLFTEEVEVSVLSGWKSRVLWLVLDNEQELRLVCAEVQKGRWVATLAEGRDEGSWSQKAYTTEKEARKHLQDKLIEYMKRYEFKRITLQAHNYRELMAKS